MSLIKSTHLVTSFDQAWSSSGHIYIYTKVKEVHGLSINSFMSCDMTFWSNMMLPTSILNQVKADDNVIMVKMWFCYTYGTEFSPGQYELLNTTSEKPRQRPALLNILHKAWKLLLQILFIWLWGNSKQPLNFTVVSYAAVGETDFCCVHKHDPRTQSYVLKNSCIFKWADLVDLDMDKWKSQRVQFTTTDIFYQLIFTIFPPILFEHIPEFIHEDVVLPTLTKYCGVFKTVRW